MAVIIRCRGLGFRKRLKEGDVGRGGSREAIAKVCTAGLQRFSQLDLVYVLIVEQRGRGCGREGTGRVRGFGIEVSTGGREVRRGQ